jgi:2-polyprenyl-6-methoxyphenol hydroxylase-like FAD-dependent oxidoreductase
MKQRSAEIAGAGLAGLAVATRLAQLGWKVRLHERSADLRMFGAGIWLWNNGLKSLKILGAYDAAVRRAKTVKEWRICDGQGRLLMSRPANAADPLLIPPRADLYEALIDRAEAAGVEILTSSVVARSGPVHELDRLWSWRRH